MNLIVSLKLLIRTHRRRDLYNEADEEEGEDGFHGFGQLMVGEGTPSEDLSIICFHISYHDVEGDM